MRPFILSISFLLLGCTQPVAVLDAPTDQILEIELREVKVIYQPSAPPYPKEAKEARIDGIVTLSMVVGKDGRVISASATSGPELLRKSVEENYLKYVFQPLLKNGQNRIIRFPISAIFRLN